MRTERFLEWDCDFIPHALSVDLNMLFSYFE